MSRDLNLGGVQTSGRPVGVQRPQTAWPRSRRDPDEPAPKVTVVREVESDEIATLKMELAAARVLAAMYEALMDGVCGQCDGPMMRVSIVDRGLVWVHADGHEVAFDEHHASLDRVTVSDGS